MIFFQHILLLSNESLQIFITKIYTHHLRVDDMTIPLTIKQIEMLVKISEGKGVSEAARLLNLTPSAVSKGLAVMEEKLGVSLIQRTTRTFQLTDAGEYFVSRASELLNEFDDIVNETSGYFNHPHGVLKITCSVAFGYAHLIDIFEEYRKKIMM